MNLQNIGTLLGFAAVALLSWQLGGSAGAGLVLGFLLGAAASGLGIAWQRRLLRTDQRRALGAFVASFLGKLILMLVCALALRFVDPLGARIGWRTFVLGFAGAVMAIHLLRALDGVLVARHSRAH